MPSFRVDASLFTLKERLFLVSRFELGQSGLRNSSTHLRAPSGTFLARLSARDSEGQIWFHQYFLTALSESEHFIHAGTL